MKTVIRKWKICYERTNHVSPERGVSSGSLTRRLISAKSDNLPINSGLFRLQRNDGTVKLSLILSRRSHIRAVRLPCSGRVSSNTYFGECRIRQACTSRPPSPPVNTDSYFNTRSEGSLIFFCSPFVSSSSSPKDPRYCTWTHSVSCESGTAYSTQAREKVSCSRYINLDTFGKAGRGVSL